MDRQEESLHRFGQRLTELRKQQDLTIGELATRCGLDPQQLEQIEAGEINFPVTTIYALARGLKLPPGELVRFF